MENSILLQAHVLQALLTMQGKLADTAGQRIILQRMGIGGEKARKGASSALDEFQKVQDTLCGYMNADSYEEARTKARRILTHLELAESLEAVVVQGEAQCQSMRDTNQSFLETGQTEDAIADTLEEAEEQVANARQHLDFITRELRRLLAAADIPVAPSQVDLVRT